MSAMDEQVLTRDERDEQIAEGGLAAFREGGFTRQQGDEEIVDPEKIAKGILPLALGARVDSLDDRTENAISKGDLTAKLLPDVIGPGDMEWDDAGEIGHGIWDWCERRVWNQTNPNAGGKVQEMVRTKGLTLCRTKISRNSTLIPAVYVTA